MLPMTPSAVPTLPSAFAAFAASQLRSPLVTPSPSLAHILQSPHFQNMLQSQVAALQAHQLVQNSLELPSKSPKTPTIYPSGRKRVGGSTMKTAKVWRFFDELPTPEQAAECRICRKKIKATNSSTTGMIRHLRSCHVTEYQLVQEARQTCMLMKMEEKAKVQMLREMNTDAMNNTRPITKKSDSEQKSPSASSSASDTASSTTSSAMFAPLPPLPPLIVPQGLPAPKPVKVILKSENGTEIEDSNEQDQTTTLSTKSSAFASIKSSHKSISDEDDESKKLNAQIALMILMDHQSPNIVDKPGFRQLIRFLKPSHQLPYSNSFQNELIPEILAQIRQFGAMMMLNNPIPNPFETLTSILPQTNEIHNMSFGSESSKTEEKREDDSDSASSADTEQDLSSKIDVLANYLGTSIPQEELSSLVSVCHNVYNYFEDRQQLFSQLSMVRPSSEPSHPTLLKELLFVASNSEAINSYIRSTPDMDILPISDSQRRLLSELLPKHC
ncbi:unnamed protein product [Auanema sp. JU1783]|nr:unnamed protein product [Auanema sp. JU1783]